MNYRRECKTFLGEHLRLLINPYVFRLSSGEMKIMRPPSLAVFTVTIILAGALTAQAGETSDADNFPLEPFNTNGNLSDITPQVSQSIVTIEQLEEQLFFQKTTTNSLPKTDLTSPPVVPETGQIKREDETPTLTPTPTNRTEFSNANTLNPETIQEQTLNLDRLVADAATNTSCLEQSTENIDLAGESTSYQLAQAGTPSRCRRPQPVAPLVIPEPFEEFGASPALSIYIPVGYGADRNTLFLNGSYQATVRDDDGSVGTGGVGIGVGNADKAVGVELSYALETTDDNFGDGGFNAKLHRRFAQDLSAALGWNGFLNITNNDFEQSKYGVITKIFRTQESLDQAFSRIAVTVGVGDGQFRSNGAVDDGVNNINVFGNIALRVARPISFIAEWTGQDLGLGLSIAPFRNIPFVITPAVRDVAGAGDEARFVIGAGTALRF